MGNRGWGYQKRIKESGVAPSSTRLVLADPLAAPRVPVPEVTFVDGPGPPRIEWWRRYVAEARPLTNLLPRFIKLTRAGDEAVAAFAREWGPLGICLHGLPGMHRGCPPLSSDERYWESSSERDAWFVPTGHYADPDSPWRYWEPIAPWRFYAGLLRAYLTLASDLQQGRPTRPEDWETLVHSGTGFDKQRGWQQGSERSIYRLALGLANLMPAKRRTAELRTLFQGWLADLANVGALYPEPVLTEKRRWVWTVGLAGGRVPDNIAEFFDPHPWPRNSLFSLLAAQVAAATAAGDVRFCPCEGLLPAGSRRSRVYCDECGANRDRERAAEGMRALRARRRPPASEG